MNLDLDIFDNNFIFLRLFVAEVSCALSFNPFGQMEKAHNLIGGNHGQSSLLEETT